MKHKNRLILAGAILLLLSAVTLPAVAAGGPPEGKGNKKGDVGKSVEGFLYGDLYVMERDGNGEPFIYDGDSGSPCYDSTTAIGCAQPLMEDCSYVPLMCQYDGDWSLDQEILDCLAEANIDPATWEPELCDLNPCYLEDVQEVHFGRMSVARTTPDVVLKAYIEALSTINSATAVGQDLAGRIVLDLPLLDEDGQQTVDYIDTDFDGVCDLDENGNLVTVDTYKKTIDSPLENLALYRELMINSCLGGVLDTYVGEGGGEIEEWTYLEEQAIDLLMADPVLKHLVCEYPEACYDEAGDPLPPWYCPITPAAVVTFPDHDLAATFVGAAADKSGHVNLDMLVNANSYLEINTVFQPSEGQAPVVTYHNFIEGEVADQTWYQYDSTAKYEEGAFTPLLSADSCGVGCFCVADVYPFEPNAELFEFANSAVPVCRGGVLLDAGEPATPYYCRSEGGVLDETLTPFSLGLNSTAPGCGGANWFTQAAEDARQAIWFLHNWSIPDIGACEEPVP